MHRQATRRWAPPRRLGTTEWATRHRYLAAASSALPGRYDVDVTPYMRGIHAAMDDPETREVVLRKSAQVAWTDGGLINYLFARIDMDPAAAIVLFPKREDAQDFVLQKLLPAIEVTPRLAALVDRSGSRRAGNRLLFWQYPGGFLRLVTSRSTGSVKSTPAPILCVEEPDDAERDLRGQGDSIYLLRERAKTFGKRSKLLIGGTPSVAGLSTIDHEYHTSDQRLFMVPCHDCHDAHALDWNNVSWREQAGTRHEIYGRAQPETAVYACPHCGTPWDDTRRVRNVRDGEWEAQAAFHGKAGFHLNELYAPWDGSRVEVLVRDYINAQYLLQQGDDSKIVVFTNSRLGLPYAYKTDAPEAEELQERAEDYAEATVPDGASVLTVGVDVQHNRFAIKVVGWGPGEESWLVLNIEIHGAVTDSSDPVWLELDRYVWGSYLHASGAWLRASAVGIDASDGQTSDNVYRWVRRHRDRGAMAVKGASHDQQLDREIYTRPKAVDHRSDTKAARYGLRVHIVGTHKAKDLIASRMKLTGAGAGRMHWYDAGATYFQQMVSEVCAPSRRHRGRRVWQLKAGQRNEAWDCEVYALHAARKLKLHVRPRSWWDALARRLVQRDLVADAEQLAMPADAVTDATTAASEPPERVDVPAPAAPVSTRAPKRRRRGFATTW